MLNQFKKYFEIADYLKYHDFKIVHIVRENLLKTHISQIRARHTGVYVARNDQQQIKIALPRSQILKDLDNIKNQNYILTQSIEQLGLCCCTVSYERLQSQKNDQLHRILEFLGVESSVNLSPKSAKITSDDLSQVIENYDEIYSLLKNSEYKKYLS